MNRSRLMAAVLAGLAMGDAPEAVANRIATFSRPITKAMRQLWNDRRGYPQTGTGNRAGARYAKQQRRFALRTPSMGLHIKHAGRWWNRDDPNLDRQVRADYINARAREALALRAAAD